MFEKLQTGEKIHDAPRLYRLYSEPALKVYNNMCCSRRITYICGKGPKKEKIPPTLGLKPQFTQCLVGATLSSPPGGMDFFP